jgi:hypothetical protein
LDNNSIITQQTKLRFPLTANAAGSAAPRRAD